MQSEKEIKPLFAPAAQEKSRWDYCEEMGKRKRQLEKVFTGFRQKLLILKSGVFFAT
jgi:hypothetical protein